MASLRAACFVLATLCAMSNVLAGPFVSDGYEAYGTSRYKLYPFKAKWHEALAVCQQDGGGSHLVVINSESERNIVVYLFNRVRDAEHLFVGINDLASEGHWVTVTGGPVITSGYSMWDRGQPDNRDVEDCGSIVRSGKYNDLKCSYQRPFVCEKDGL